MSGRATEALRTRAVWFARDSHVLLRVHGADAAAWLHGQTTNDAAGLVDGAGNHQALLDRKGRVLAEFSLHRHGDAFWVLIERAQAGTLFERLETHRFMEDVACDEVETGAVQCVVAGPWSPVLLAHLLDGPPETAAALLPRTPGAFAPLDLGGREVLAFRRDILGEAGFVLIAGPGESGRLRDWLKARADGFGVPELDAPSAERLRIEAGVPRFERDLSRKSIISETPLAETALSFDKGCFPGQEVVARLRAYGAPRRTLLGLVFDGGGVPKPGVTLHAEGVKAGEVTSAVYSPALEAPIALASLARGFRTHGSAHRFTLDDSGETRAARVVHLPFLRPTPPEDLARRRYAEALDLFERDPDDTDARCYEWLREAVALDPGFEDAWEALGVVYHRHGRLEDAIRAMEQLAALDPDSVMAHSNLSRFYAARGWIAEAEAEKARAEELALRRHLDERAAERRTEEMRQRALREAEQRIAMFREVLELDPDDTMALMGFGASFMQLGRHAEAVAHLARAVELDPEYSAAWLKLGQSHQQLGALESAARAYRNGIGAASRKGDFMPMREMERRLNDLARHLPDSLQFSGA